MLQHLPSAFGRALRNVRAGAQKLAVQQVSPPDDMRDIARLEVRSPAFSDGGRIPARYTADGDGISPPLEWSGVPQKTSSLVLLVEDPDSPTPKPMVHAIACGLTRAKSQLPEGALSEPDGRLQVGRNSFLGKGYTPPDPPPGHGPHRYAFELFALDYDPALGDLPGRSKVLSALQGHVLARGSVTGIYERAPTK
jgi:Raf kinase inhibitor-like YbhB/YbcL family protein